MVILDSIGRGRNSFSFRGDPFLLLIPFPERIRAVDSRHVYPHLIVPPQFRKQVLSPNAPFAGIEKPGGRVDPGNFDDPEAGTRRARAIASRWRIPEE